MNPSHVFFDSPQCGKARHSDHLPFVSRGHKACTRFQYGVEAGVFVASMTTPSEHRLGSVLDWCDRRRFLVDLDQFCGITRLSERLRNDEGDAVTHEADAYPIVDAVD